jgi:dTDP-4-amino-4,6-dideoxygalactose transaminase
LFVVRHPQRNTLQQKLTEAGIGTLIHYPVPPHLSGAYANLESRKQKVESGSEETKNRKQKSENKNEFQLSAFPISALKNDLWSFPIAEQLASTVLSLPIGPHLDDKKTIEVVTALNSIYPVP